MIGRLQTRFARLAAMAAAAGLTLTACDTSQYAFRVDESIDIEQPPAREDVELPVTIRWTDTDVPPASEIDRSDAGARFYAVFVDRAPIRPGATLASLADDSEQCSGQVLCPDDVALRDKGVYLTATPAVVLEFLSDRRVNDRNKDQHEITIVRMEGDERRGEAAWSRTFYVLR